MFDGVCNLCNSSVQFIIKHDTHKRFVFTSLQSDVSKEILLQFQNEKNDLSSILLVEKGTIYKESTAVLKIFRHLGKGFPILYVFIIIPPFIRNFLYRIIAKNRYKWFGKKEQCMLPSDEFKNRFL